MIQYFKSVLEQDPAPVVLCDLEHRIIYMNPSACERYRKYGGERLLGRNLLACHDKASAERICQVLAWFEADTANNRVLTGYSAEENKDVYMVALRDQTGMLIGYYEKHEFRSRDTADAYGAMLHGTET